MTEFKPRYMHLEDGMIHVTGLVRLSDVRLAIASYQDMGLHVDQHVVKLVNPEAEVMMDDQIKFDVSRAIKSITDFAETLSAVCLKIEKQHHNPWQRKQSKRERRMENKRNMKMAR